MNIRYPKVGNLDIDKREAEIALLREFYRRLITEKRLLEKAIQQAEALEIWCENGF